MPADAAAVAAYLAERTEQGAAASTVRSARAAIGAAHRDQGAADPFVLRTLERHEHSNTIRGAA